MKDERQSSSYYVKSLRVFCAIAIAFLLGFNVNSWLRLHNHNTLPITVKCPTVDAVQIEANQGTNSHDISRPTTEADGDRYSLCDVPSNSSEWRYYRALVDENTKVASLARNSTNKFTPNKKNDESSSSIPHRLIFTHKYHLFDCSISAHIMTPPDLYNLAENGKATVNAYKQIWSDLEVVFLTDEGCRRAINATEPRLLPFFEKLPGMFKADICRSADLYLNGGYYYDIDLLVVRPFIAPKQVEFATVKGSEYPNKGFFQAFTASKKKSPIIKKSLDFMLGMLEGRRKQRLLMGPVALMEAWMSLSLRLKTNSTYLLTETTMMKPTIGSTTDYDVLPKQYIPVDYGDACLYAPSVYPHGVCNYVVLDENDNNAIYFYSHMLGTRWCGKRMRNDVSECPHGPKD